MTNEQEQFLHQYLQTLNPKKRKAIPNVSAYYFCADEYNANECARLIDIGQKTASCSLKQGWEVDDEPLPNIGELVIVLNWSQEPVCIIRITDVSICPFKDVTADFAEAEGEGDLSYGWWHNAHIKFFTQYAEKIGATFTEESDLVLERFEKIYPL